MSKFRTFTELFGLRALHDLDTIHEPSATGADPWPPNLTDRPAAQGGEASAAGHPNDDEVVAALRDAFRGELDHLRQVLTDAEIEARWLLSNVQAAVSLL